MASLVMNELIKCPKCSVDFELSDLEETSNASYFICPICRHHIKIKPAKPISSYIKNRNNSTINSNLVSTIKKFKYQISTILTILLLFVILFTKKEQKIVFCGESIRYKHSTPASECHRECTIYGKQIKTYLDQGWSIVSAHEKDIIAIPFENLTYSNRYTGCACVGTEYVLEKFIIAIF